MDEISINKHPRDFHIPRKKSRKFKLGYQHLAPKELVERYGDKSGFYEKVGNIRAIISIRSPLSAALEDAKEVFIYLSVAAFFVFGGIYALICYFFGKISKRDSLLTAKTAELEELNKTLEERVASEIEKRVQKEELLIQQSKMVSMGEMIGAIAHQWKQPLNALSIIASDVKYAYEYKPPIVTGKQIGRAHV